MSDDYIDARFFIHKADDGEFTEKQIDDLLDDFLGFLEDRGLCGGGAWGPPVSLDKACPHCEGTGDKEFIDEENKCETCDGSGRKTEEEPTSDPEAVEAWNDLYAPITQGTESSFPKREVEGSNPSRSASNARISSDRESDREPGDESVPGDGEGVRGRSEDPGRDHSGEDG